MRRSSATTDLPALFKSESASWDAAVVASEDATLHCFQCGVGMPVYPLALHARLLQAATAREVIYTMRSLAEAINPAGTGVLGCMHAYILAVHFSRSRERFESTLMDMHVIKHDEHNFEVWATAIELSQVLLPRCPSARSFGGRFTSHAHFVRHVMEGVVSPRTRFVYVNTAAWSPR